MRYFLGVDIGATKTHALLADETGQVVGFGQGGPGNHEVVGYDGLQNVLRAVTGQALAMAQVSKGQIAGAGFGVAGYDFPPEREPTLAAIGEALRLTAPVDAVNDAVLGILAGCAAGWGLAVVSGTGCNCWGRDQTRRRYGQVTGHSYFLGENAGASELMRKVAETIAYEWTRRGPATALTPAIVRYLGATDVVDLLHGLSEGRFSLDPAAARLVFDIAAAGDPVAIDVIRWAGCELGELAKAVIRQLNFEALAFDVALTGSMFNGGPLLIEPMTQTIQALAPAARLVRVNAPPVAGAALLGMEQGGLDTVAVRPHLLASTEQFLQHNRTEK